MFPQYISPSDAVVALGHLLGFETFFQFGLPKNTTLSSLLVFFIVGFCTYALMQTTPHVDACVVTFSSFPYLGSEVPNLV